jgi:cytochrome c
VASCTAPSLAYKNHLDDPVVALSIFWAALITTLPGYNFSEPPKRLDIIWTQETIAKFFEICPAAYTPGTKIPEQVIDNRTALVRFLAKATSS